MKHSCLFCRIIVGEIPADIVYQDEQIIAFRDISPAAPTHLLLVPKRHIADVTSLTAADGTLLAQIYTVAAELARQEGIDAEGFRVVVNNGPGAGQTVLHLHFHLLGGRALGWPAG